MTFRNSNAAAIAVYYMSFVLSIYFYGEMKIYNAIYYIVACAIGYFSSKNMENFQLYNNQFYNHIGFVVFLSLVIFLLNFYDKSSVPIIFSILIGNRLKVLI